MPGRWTTHGSSKSRKDPSQCRKQWISPPCGSPMQKARRRSSELPLPGSALRSQRPVFASSAVAAAKTAERSDQMSQT